MPSLSANADPFSLMAVNLAVLDVSIRSLALVRQLELMKFDIN